ncbi:MAG: iron ABC transporter permease [Myxococcales bacterium]|nr:iron ABC transporter permease [Myxococcales bacterium]
MLTRWLMVGVLLVLASASLGVLLGSDDASLPRALAEPGFDRTVLLSLRLPRVILAMAAGGGLAVVGAAFQALLKNPLAEPYVLGVSGGAALGATTVMALGVASLGVVAAAVVPLAALAGGLLATFVVYAVARRAPWGPSGASILLAGVMVNSIASALITFGKLLVPPARAQTMLRWLVGFIELTSMPSLIVVVVVVLFGSAWLIAEAARMNLLALGDEAAAHLGLDVTALERRIFVLSSLVVGAVVSVTGLIGFVGLVVPHAVRRTVGPDHRRVLPLSFLGGAVLLVLCDLGTRLAFRAFGTKLPVGAVTALIGGPTFLWMLTRRGE